MNNINRVFSAFLFLIMFIMQASAEVRLIIKYKPSAKQQQLLSSGRISQRNLNAQMMMPLTSSRMSQISMMAGVGVKEVSQIANGAHVVELQQNNLSEYQVQSIIDNIKKSDSTIQYVEVDRVLKRMAMPQYNQAKQWDMVEAVNGDNFQNLQSSWNTLYPNESLGNGVVVAVIDTGYTPHSNFLNNLEPYSGTCASLSGGNTAPTCYGYTFLSNCSWSHIPNCTSANYVQPDALDWGDFTSTENSSWHGSHVTGTIVANGYRTGNTNTILGGAYGAKVVPIRALGSGGGYDSDLANAIYWAVDQYSIPNANPAQVINMSLGGVGSCGSTLQDAINTAINNGAIVVAAAGNADCSSGNCILYNVSQISPANCNNVISVSAKGNTNGLSWYSSYGNTTITASGGDLYPQSYIVGTCGSNETCSDIWHSPQLYQTPASGGAPTYISYEGTSQATPHVSAAIADIIAYFNNINIPYNLSTITDILQSSATHLTESSNEDAQSTTMGQGGSVSGLTLDANNALLYAISLYTSNWLSASPTSWGPTSNSQQTFTFTNESTNTITVESYVIVTAAGTSFTFNVSNNTCISQIQANGTCTLTLSLTSYGVGSATLQLLAAQSTIVAIVPININNHAPAPAPSGGGGGCSAIQYGDDYSLIFILLSLSIIYYFKRRCLRNEFYAKGTK